ncbi:ASKHA domain-containing protein [Trichloromonas sp.]|uniref:ASKHA domain-containing protein n=1 Tax=Trichloromonas sp. TaxID=3069249 RepID=UPI002A3D78D9|nr:ASKHA domain-containing protein [Trichloromonas sp.]
MNPSDSYLALDLGTTTLAGRLVDASGRTLAESRLLNPQRELGSDVIRRLEAARAGEGERLQGLLVTGIDRLLAELLSLSGRPRQSLRGAAAAANPAISHLLRRLSVDAILFPPHRPRHPEGALLDPAELGLDLPVPLYLFPLVSGYVGGDLVAFLFACPPPETTSLYIDVGTNGEMALFAEGRWWVTSVPAGPAFEGDGIACGMAATPGAIRGVRIEGDVLRLLTVADRPPLGLCGSGLVAAVAAALDGGLMDRHGTFLDPDAVETNLARYLVANGEGPSLRLYRDAARELRLTQDDIRAFQLAKGAVRAGVDCLLGRAKVAAGEVGAVILTGSFGLSLAPAALKKVAMLPENMVDRVRFVPAGALSGTVRYLLEPDAATRLESLVKSLTPYPLSGTPAFEKAFLHALDF